MTAELTSAQRTILDRVRADGTTVFEGRKLPAIVALAERGLVTYQTNHIMVGTRARTGKGRYTKSYTVRAEITDDWTPVCDICGLDAGDC